MKQDRQIAQKRQNWAKARQRIGDLMTGSLGEEAMLLELLFSDPTPEPPAEKAMSPEAGYENHAELVKG